MLEPTAFDLTQKRKPIPIDWPLCTFIAAVLCTGVWLAVRWWL